MSDMPPTNIEAEEAILGGILIDPDAISRVAENLRPEFFSVSAHRTIYRSALSLFLQNSPIDLMTVTNHLTDNNKLDQIGGLAKLAQLVDRTVSAVNIDQYAILVGEKYQRRRLIEAGNNIVTLGHATELPLETVLDDAEQEIFNITQERPQQDLVSIGETLNLTFQKLEQLSEGLSSPGIPCGFHDLDVMTGGFQRSDLIIVAARPAIGKTSFCTNIAHHIASRRKVPVAFFSLEMSKEQLVQRILSGEAKIESNRLRSGQINANEWEPISRAIGELSEIPLFIDDTPSITVNEIRSKARRLKAEQGDELGMIVIDYLQLMEGSSPNNRVQELSQITRSLKGLARELNVPIIALSQLNRGVETRNDKRPLMSDLRESGALEQDSDLVIMLYRDEYYNPDTPDRGIAEVIITKHRHGATGTIKLLFDAQFTRFRNLNPKRN